MEWLKVPLKIAKAVDLEIEEDTGIPADMADGWVMIAKDEISHIIGGEESEASIYLKSGEAILVDLSISELSLLL